LSGILNTAPAKGPPPLRFTGISIIHAAGDWIQDQVVGDQPAALPTGVQTPKSEEAAVPTATLTAADQHRAYVVHALAKNETGASQWQSLVSRQSAVFHYRQDGSRNGPAYLLVWLKDREGEQVRVIDHLKNPWGALPPLADILLEQKETREVATEETGINLALNANPQPISGVVIQSAEICSLGLDDFMYLPDFVAELMADPAKDSLWNRLWGQLNSPGSPKAVQDPQFPVLLANHLFEARLEKDASFDENIAAGLLAEISTDPFVFLQPETRCKCIQSCWRWTLRQKRSHGENRAFERFPNLVVRALLRADDGNLLRSWRSGSITKSELKNVESIDLSGCVNLTDLSPVELLPNLRTLILHDCAGLTDLSPIMKLKKLEVLDLNGCNISS
jgi:hypothetical protein